MIDEPSDLDRVREAIARHSLPEPPQHGLTSPIRLYQWLVEMGALPREWASNKAEPTFTQLLEALEGTGTTAPPTYARLVSVYAPAPAGDWQYERAMGLLDGLTDLLDTRAALVRLSGYTGLVRTLRGDLWPEERSLDETSRIAISEQFLQRYERALVGTSGNHWRLDEPATCGYTARYRQTDEADLPIYGATTTCGFSPDGRMRFVCNNWYPLPVIAKFSDHFELGWAEAVKQAQAYIEMKIVPSLASMSESTIPDKHPTPEYLRGDPLSEGRVIFPLAGPPVSFRPAWVVLAVDKAQSWSWELIVDAESGDILGDRSLMYGIVHAQVVLDNIDAATIPPRLTAKDIDSPGPLAAAPHFSLQGDAFGEPTGGSTTVDRGVRSATIYYHMLRAMRHFDGLLQAVSPPGQVIRAPGAVGPRVPVELSSKPIAGYYTATSTTPSLGKIKIGTGGAGGATADPGLDCDVLYHEYAHAVVHVAQPSVIKEPFLFGRAINEGLAFYLSVTLSERPQPGAAVPNHPSRWGEFAYSAPEWAEHRDLDHKQNQAPGFDFMQVYGVYPRYSSLHDPTKDDDYACGIMLARALWDVRRVVGNERADRIVLQGLTLAGGVQSDLETLAEAIIESDRSPATGGAANERALRMLMCGRGMLADAPIHDLRAVQAAGQLCVLAATESTGGAGGCCISTDDGTTWSPLGTGAPPQVTALTTVSLGADVLVITAAEQRTAQGRTTSLISSYPLAQGGQLQLSGQWSELTRPTNAAGGPTPAVLSLAAAADANSPVGYWLYAGTAKGLFAFNGQWSALGAFASPVFGLEVSLVGGRPLLLAATGQGALIYDALNQQPQAQATAAGRPSGTATVLTLIADLHGQGHFWAGTAFDGIFHYDPGTNEWSKDSAIGRPVTALLADPGDASRLLLAGTSDGVFALENGGWVGASMPVDPNGEALEGATVAGLVALEGRTLAATAQRGLWARPDDDAWARQTGGLLPAGIQADPFGQAIRVAPAGGVATHLYHVPGQNRALNLNITLPTAGAVVQPALYRLPLAIISGEIGVHQDLLQVGPLSNLMWQQQVMPGYYLLAVAAPDGQDTSYTATVTLV